MRVGVVRGGMEVEIWKRIQAEAEDEDYRVAKKGTVSS
jgi:hypothetical protein